MSLCHGVKLSATGRAIYFCENDMTDPIDFEALIRDVELDMNAIVT